MLLEDTAKAVIAFLQKESMLQELQKGDTKHFPFEELATSFVNKNPEHSIFNVQYSLEYLAGETDILHLERSRQLHSTAAEYKYNKNSHKKLRATQARAINTEAKVKEVKEKLMDTYIKTLNEETSGEKLDKEAKARIHDLKCFVREHIDALRDISKAGITEDPIVVSAFKRMEREEEKLDAGEVLMDDLRSILSTHPKESYSEECDWSTQ